MKKRSAKSRKDLDAQVDEFERRDLGADLAAARKAGVLKVHRREKSMPTSIVLAPALVAKLKRKAGRRGIGYQTMLKIIVAEHVDEY